MGKGGLQAMTIETISTAGGFIRAQGTEARVCKDIADRQAIGQWTLLEKVEAGKHSKWLAKCSCGKEKIVIIDNLLRGKSLSCGCYRKKVMQALNTTHGQSGNSTKTRAYRSWAHMKGRCLNQDDAAYKDYGGRGISVCERWLKFENFFADMGECPPEHSIERINVNGNYEPYNCKWIHKKFQARNTRANRFDEQLVSEIRVRLLNGEKVIALAKEFGTTEGHIRQIRSKAIWKDLM